MLSEADVQFRHLLWRARLLRVLGPFLHTVVADEVALDRVMEGEMFHDGEAFTL